MNTIPWYRSSVFTAGLSAFCVQIGTMADAAFLTELMAGKRDALGRVAAAILSAVVVAVRAVASAQPLTLTQGQADAANAPVQPAQSRQGGFARPLMLALLLGIAVVATPFLQGCQALGIPQAQSFAQRYAYALSQTTALRAAATQALNARTISTADAEYVLKLTDESRKLIDQAQVIARAGEELKGKTQLELATAVLTQLQAYLTARQS